MAAVNPILDPMDEIVEQVLADPELAAEIDGIEVELATQDVAAHPGSHNAARVIAGLPPLDDTNPRL